MSISGRSSKSGMSEARRSKLENIQRREELKGLLVSKFKGKYGSASIASSVISEKVNEFLDSKPLTEKNLHNLDSEILKLKDSRPKKTKAMKIGGGDHHVPPGLSEHADYKGGNYEEEQKGDKKSEGGKLLTFSMKSGGTSVMSGATGLSEFEVESAMSASLKKKQKPPSPKKRVEHQVENVEAADIGELDEEGEWAAIMKFNKQLYDEELNQAAHLKIEQKKFIMLELDHQIAEKNERKQREKEEDSSYFTAQKTHWNYLDDVDKKKKMEQEKKKEEEKKGRERQAREKRKKIKMDNVKLKEDNIKLHKKYEDDLENERMEVENKKQMTLKTLEHMKEENETNKSKKTNEEKRLRDEDIRAQNEYTQMLELQEIERNLEKKRRMERAEQKASLAADQVIKDNFLREKADEEKIRKYEMQKEMRDMLADEQKKAKTTKDKEEMHVFLAKQVEERRNATQKEKEMGHKQAKMWKVDLAEHEEMETKAKEKMHKLNKDQQMFLFAQMDAKKGGKKKEAMSQEEYLYNRKLLAEVGEKKISANQIPKSPSQFDPDDE